MTTATRPTPVPSPTRRWSAPLFVLMGLALLPWTFWLTRTLPASHVSRHWNVAWAGFDLALATALLATALAAIRRSPWLQGSAISAGTLLLVDAWFDVLTSSTSSELAAAAAEASLVEIPLAILSFWIARDTERFWRRIERCLDARRILRKRAVERGRTFGAEPISAIADPSTRSSPMTRLFRRPMTPDARECEEVRSLFSDCADGDLDPEQQHRVEDHVSFCLRERARAALGRRFL